MYQYFLPRVKSFTACLVFLICVIISPSLLGQGNQEIYSDYVLYQKREKLDKDLRENLTARVFAMQLDSNNEHRFESACMAVSQFLFTGPQIRSGFDKLFSGYDILEFETRRAFLEAVYAVYPDDYYFNMQKLLDLEDEPILFAMKAAYLLRH